MRSTIILLLQKHLWFVVVATIFLLSRIIFLNTDFHVLEPDEGLYAGFANAFIRGEWPVFENKLYLEMIPFFYLVGGVLQKLFGGFGPFVGLRLLSVLGSFFVGLGLYLYGKHQKDIVVGLLSASVFWLLPIVFFYSRSGTQDMLFLGLSVLSVVLFRIAQERTSSLWGMLSGLLFVTAVLTKPSALVFSLSFIVFALYHKERYQYSLVWVARFLFLVLLPITIIFFLTFRTEFIAQFLNLPNKHLLPLLNPTVHIAVWFEYLKRFSWYVSWPVLLFFFTGSLNLFIRAAKQRKKMVQLYKEGVNSWWRSLRMLSFRERKTYFKKIAELFRTRTTEMDQVIDSLALALPGLLFLAIFDFSPRYFLLITPSIALITAIGLRQLPMRWTSWLWLVLILPFTYQAWLATMHTSFQAMKPKIEELQHSHPSHKLYSTVDPEKMAYYFDTPVQLLNMDVFEDGGIVITDIRKRELFENFQEPEYREMGRAWQMLKRHHLVWTYTVTYNHFPLDTRGNVFQLYLVPERRELNTP